MTKKSVTNLQKVSMILCCARETLQVMDTGNKEDVKFQVTEIDVRRAWEVVSTSMKTYQNFKVSFILIF